MSVINRMLLQLDARPASPPAQPGDSGNGSHVGIHGTSHPGGVTGVSPTATATATSIAIAPTPAARWRLPLIVLAGGSAIAAAALADLSALQPKPAAAAVVVARNDMAALPADAAAPPAAATAAAPEAPAASPAPAPSPADVPAAPAFVKPPAAKAPTAARIASPVAEPQAPAAATLSLPPPPLALPRIDKRALPSSAAERANLAHREAMDLARLGQNQAALQRAQLALAQDPAHHAARQLAAVLQHEAGNGQAALALLRDGAMQPAAPAALTLLLARLLAAQGLEAEALTVLDQHQLRSADAQGLRAGLLAQQGQYGLALPAYESAVRQEPGNALWWFGMAVALDSVGDGGRARQAFAQARQLRLPREDLDVYAEQRLRALP